MTEDKKQGMLLGRQVPVVDHYAPGLLYPIPRHRGRAAIGCSGTTPFSGVDLWHCYELSWLDTAGKPVVRVGRVTVPADSPNMVESKSFKLYLNSLNNCRYASEGEVVAVIERDIANVVGAGIRLELLDVCDPTLAGAGLPGTCLDTLRAGAVDGEPAAALLEVGGGAVSQEQLHSHLLRSLCPVTGQPDWASVWIHYRGVPLSHESVLRYLIAFRNHQEFHEQCVERIFCDLHARLAPEFLHVQAFYTRRGGLDINPFRSTDPAARPLPRMNRQ